MKQRGKPIRSIPRIRSCCPKTGGWSFCLVFERYETRGKSAQTPRQKKKSKSFPAGVRLRPVLVEHRGLDSRRELRALVARGRNSPPDCFSVPLVLRALHSLKAKRRPASGRHFTLVDHVGKRGENTPVACFRRSAQKTL